MSRQYRRIPVAKTREFAHSKIKGFRVDGKHYVLVKSGEDYYCFDGLCPHEEGLLSFGQVQGRYLYCTYHQAVFEVDTGKAVPGSPTDKPLRRHPVKVEADTIYAELEDSAGGE